MSEKEVKPDPIEAMRFLTLISKQYREEFIKDKVFNEEDLLPISSILENPKKYHTIVVFQLKDLLNFYQEHRDKIFPVTGFLGAVLYYSWYMVDPRNMIYTALTSLSPYLPDRPDVPRGYVYQFPLDSADLPTYQTKAQRFLMDMMENEFGFPSFYNFRMQSLLGESLDLNNDPQTNPTN